MTYELQPGLTHRLTLKVEEALTVPAVFPAAESFAAMPPVFATAFLVGLIERACIEALTPLLSDGERTVGTHVDISHCAATPVGMEVTAEVTLEAVSGRHLAFRVTAWDAAGTIGAGRHERHRIDLPRFLESVERKRAAV